VAVAAIDAQFPRVMPVAERHRLILCEIHVREVGRTAQSVKREGQYQQRDQRAVNADSRDRLRARMENLRHLCFSRAFPVLALSAPPNPLPSALIPDPVRASRKSRSSAGTG